MMVNKWRPIIFTENNDRSPSRGMRSTITTAVLVYDGECEFCKACVRFVQKRFRREVAVAAYQELDVTKFGLTVAQCAQAVQWVQTSETTDDPFGSGLPRVISGSAAVAQALRASRPPWNVVGIAVDLPGVRGLAARIYRLVAARRRCSAPTPPAD